MRTSKLPVLSVLLLLSIGCATRYEYTIIFEQGLPPNNTELVRAVDNALKIITDEFSFTYHVNRVDNGQPVSFYHKRYSYSLNEPISLLFLHNDLIIRLSSNDRNTDEIEGLKRRLLEEIGKIAGSEKIKIEEKDVPRPWFDSV